MDQVLTRVDVIVDDEATTWDDTAESSKSREKPRDKSQPGGLIYRLKMVRAKLK